MLVEPRVKGGSNVLRVHQWTSGLSAIAGVLKLAIRYVIDGSGSEPGSEPRCQQGMCRVSIGVRTYWIRAHIVEHTDCC